jgi:hypothetical protein
MFLVASMGLIGLTLSMLSALPSRNATIPTAQVVGGKRSPIQRAERAYVVMAHVVGAVMIAALVGVACLVAIGHPPWGTATAAVTAPAP